MQGKVGRKSGDREKAWNPALSIKAASLRNFWAAQPGIGGLREVGGGKGHMEGLEAEQDMHWGSGEEEGGMYGGGYSESWGYAGRTSPHPSFVAQRWRGTPPLHTYAMLS